MENATSAPQASPGLSEASRYWASNLDPQNLEGRRGGPDLEEEIAFAWTPDVAEAFHWIAEPQQGPPLVVDLGAGLGAVSIAMARRGARVIAVDSSLERLGQLMARARGAGCADRILPVVATAEALPFDAESLPGLFTKSVLIHTDLPRAAAEIGRVLSPGGRAGLVEPQPGNPFAWLYRNTLAPKAWKSITRYFDDEAQRICLAGIGPGRVRRFYLTGFLAFAFQYALPRQAIFQSSLRLFDVIDRPLLGERSPFGRLAWFGVIEAQKPFDSR